MFRYTVALMYTDRKLFESIEKFALKVGKTSSKRESQKITF